MGDALVILNAAKDLGLDMTKILRGEAFCREILRSAQNDIRMIRMRETGRVQHFRGVDACSA